MGGISRFFDLSQANASLKLLGRKQQDDGFEAPRNSLELSAESSQEYYPLHEDIPYSYQMKNPSVKTYVYPSDSAMKTLIDEELSNRSINSRSAPSVVARLMGMDTMPSEVRPVVHAKECREESLRNNVPRKEPIDLYSDHQISLGSKPFKQLKKEILPYTKIDSSQQIRNFSSTKPQQREHPQEELLQRFKKDFEAWQTSKVWEHTRTIDVDSKVREVKDNKTIAQEILNKEKLARYADAKRNSAQDSFQKSYTSTTIPELATWQGSGFKKEAYTSKQLTSKDQMPLVKNVETTDSVHLPVAKLDQSLDRSLSSSRIVILRPSSEGDNEIDGSTVGSSKRLYKEGSMEEFLEEVKERLKQEIQGKTRIRGIETETYITEKSTDPKQIARHIAKQIRESATTDVGPKILRSESTRSYRNEAVPDYPELISRDTRKLLSDRLKNVLKNKTKEDAPLNSDGRSKASLIAKEGVRLRPMYDLSEMGKKVGYREDKKSLSQLKTKSYKSDHERSGSFGTDTTSPRNLIRSLSAPVSGTAFERLLLEDQHVLTGAHIRRKQELSEHASEEMIKTKKDGFNLKDRVSSLRHNFSLKAKLFRKKIQVHELAAIDYDYMKNNVTTPSVIMNLGTPQDNYTEVPPSPASVCSSSFDDFFRPGHPSPDSPLKVPYVEDLPSLQVTGEFDSFPEPKSFSEELASDEPEVTTAVESYEDETCEIGHPEAYARKVLVTAGLYQAQAFNQAFSTLDALTRPMSKWVFEKVEEVYNNNGNPDEEGSSPSCVDTGLSRKMFFDLMNEALPRILRPPATHVTFKKWVVCPVPIPHGRQLLSDLMHQIRKYIDQQPDDSHSPDSKMAWDLKMNPWPSIPYEEIELRDIECSILRDLINELVLDMFS